MLWLLISSVYFVHIAIFLDDSEHFDIFNAGVNFVVVVNARYFWASVGRA